MPIRLTQQGCKKRQSRFAQYLAQRHFDLGVLTDWRDVYYFSGVILEKPWPRAFVIEPGGKSAVVVEGEYPHAVADRQLVYPVQTMATLNFEPNVALAGLLQDAIPQAKRIAVQQESLLAMTARVILDRSGGELIPIDDELLRTQAIKDEDEMARFAPIQ